MSKRLKAARSWVDANIGRALFAALGPIWMTVVVGRDPTTLVVDVLAVGAGLAAPGSVLPTRAREALTTMAGIIAVICGTVVSIVFGESLSNPGVMDDPAFSPLLFGFMWSGVAASVGRQITATEERASWNELMVRVAAMEAARVEDSAYLRELVRLSESRSRPRAGWFRRR